MKTKETSKKRLCQYCFSTETCCTDIEAETCENLEKLDEETSTRQLALAWWNQLHILVKMKHAQNYFTRDDSINLTGREIEEIWKSELPLEERESYYGIYKSNPTTQVVREAMKEVSKDVQEPKCVRDGLVKPNQKQYSQEEVDRLLDQQAARTTAQILENKKKQFKQFDENLFKAYIDKFDDESLEKAKRLIEAKQFLRNLNK